MIHSRPFRELVSEGDYINIRGLGTCAIEMIPFGTTLEVRQVTSGDYYLVSDVAVLARWPDLVYYAQTATNCGQEEN